MPQPKKKTSNSKQGHTRHHWKAKVSTLVKCKNCGEMKLAHRVCMACGFYNGKFILEPKIKVKKGS